MNWKLVLLGSVAGWVLQFAGIVLLTQQWFTTLIFPGADGWGLFAAGMASIYVYLYIVLPTICLCVFGFVYKKSMTRKSRNALLAAFITTLPILLFLILQFMSVNHIVVPA